MPPLTPEHLTALRERALRVREHIIRMATDGGCFIGASLSCADILVYLYTHFLRIGPERLDDPERDYLFLSKGHDVPALYGTLAEVGILDPARLRDHLTERDHIYLHPNRAVPGIEYHAGSLGHLLPVATGVALECSMRRGPNRVVVITGDGELDEGSNWEALLLAHAWKLDNLVAIVDRNAFQANLPTEELVPLEPLVDKAEAFGWRAERVDGHDFAALHAALGRVPFEKNRPSMIVADTVRGKGLPGIERRADRWFCDFTHDEVRRLLAELHGEAGADLTSDTLIVR
jgi:transketolase